MPLACSCSVIIPDWRGASAWLCQAWISPRACWYPASMMASKAEGLQTFDQDIHRLWTLGLITDEEAFRAADSANNLRLRMRGIGVGGQ